MKSTDGRPVIGISPELDDERFKLRYAYADWVTGAGGLPVVMAPVIERLEDYLALCDGFLIPGGDDPEPDYYGEKREFGINPEPRRRTDFDLALIGAAASAGKPLLGICYGMQMIAVAAGGSLYQDIGGQNPAALDHLRGGDHPLEIEAGLGKEARSMGIKKIGRRKPAVNSSHHQAVRETGEKWGLRVLARGPDGVTEALASFEEGRGYILGVQWHPEQRPESPLSENIIERFIKSAKSATGHR